MSYLKPKPGRVILTCLLIVIIVLFLGMIQLVQAKLIDRGGGLIYDTDLDITWLYDVNYVNTTGYDDMLYGFNTNGSLSWADAVTWAKNLEYRDTVRDVTWDDWRLPKRLPVNPLGYNLNFSLDGSTDWGYNVTSPNSEMAYMYYVNLGNLGYFDKSGTGPQSEWGLQNTGPFVNLQPIYNWSGTDYPPGTGCPWAFNFRNGEQSLSSAGGMAWAWAVRDGDVSPAP